MQKERNKIFAETTFIVNDFDILQYLSSMKTFNKETNVPI